MGFLLSLYGLYHNVARPRSFKKYFLMGKNPVSLVFYKVVVFPSAMLWAYCNESNTSGWKIIDCIHFVGLQRG